MTEGAASHSLDLPRLAQWLRTHVEDFSGELTAKKFTGGQSNPTYLLALGDNRRYVLRRKPGGVLLPSAHAVEREFQVMRALADSAVPVARMRALCTDAEVIGTAFYVMDYVEGRTFWDTRLPELTRAERAAVYDAMNDTIASLHSVDFAARGLADFGRPGNYFARQIARWSRQYRATETERIEAMERLLAWLPEHIPAADETCLVHGDFRIDNLIFHPREPRVRAVIDWELSTLGHPLADLAYHVMMWRLSSGEFRGLLDADLAALGIPTESDYVARYLRRTGRETIDASEWEFAIAYNLFRVACIRQGVLKRALAGNASSEQALQAGQRARAMADIAWRQVERLQR